MKVAGEGRKYQESVASAKVKTQSSLSSEVSSEVATQVSKTLQRHEGGVESSAREEVEREINFDKT